MIMEILHCQGNFSRVESGSVSREAAVSLQMDIQVTPAKEIHDKVQPGLCLEAVLQPEKEWMLHSHENVTLAL
jgi:hypothetical protein